MDSHTLCFDRNELRVENHCNSHDRKSDMNGPIIPEDSQYMFAHVRLTVEFISYHDILMSIVCWSFQVWLQSIFFQKRHLR